MGIRMFIGFVCTVVVLGLIWLMSFSDSMDRYTRDIQAIETGILSATEQIVKQKQQLELRLQTNALVEEIARKTAARDQLRQEILEQEAEAARVAESQSAAIYKVRDASIGMTFPTLVFANRRVLKDAVIQRFTDDRVTLKHSEGVTNARAEDLPEELRDRLRLGEIVTAKPATGSTVVVTPPPATLGSAPPSPEDQVKKYKRELAEKRITMQQLHDTVRRLDYEIRQAEIDLNRGLSATQKYHVRNRRDQLSAQLATYQRAYGVAMAEVRRMEAMPPDLTGSSSQN